MMLGSPLSNVYPPRLTADSLQPSKESSNQWCGLGMPTLSAHMHEALVNTLNRSLRIQSYSLLNPFLSLVYRSLHPRLDVMQKGGHVNF